MNITLIHYHIFKNAGTSVDAMLQRCLDHKWSPFEGAHSTDILSHADLRNFLKHNENIVAVSSHLARPPLPTPGSFGIAFLRDPILRAKSVYNFVRRSPDQDGHRYSLNGFAEYIRWALNSSNGGVVIRNYQVIHLSSASFRGPIHSAVARDCDLVEAKATIDALGGVGIVERFNESMALYARRYSSLFPECDFRPAWKNRSSEEGGLSQSRDRIERELGAELYKALLANNTLDQAAYSYASDLLAASLAEAGIG